MLYDEVRGTVGDPAKPSCGISYLLPAMHRVQPSMPAPSGSVPDVRRGPGASGAPTPRHQPTLRRLCRRGRDPGRWRGGAQAGLPRQHKRCTVGGQAETRSVFDEVQTIFCSFELHCDDLQALFSFGKLFKLCQILHRTGKYLHHVDFYHQFRRCGMNCAVAPWHLDSKPEAEKRRRVFVLC